MTQVNTIADQVHMYQFEHHAPPQRLQALAQPDNTGNAYMASKDLIDPWQKPYQYDAKGPHHDGKTPDVWTTAPDGTVIGNW
jgi:general secretion pathway protein G